MLYQEIWTEIIKILWPVLHTRPDFPSLENGNPHHFQTLVENGDGYPSCFCIWKFVEVKVPCLTLGFPLSNTSSKGNQPSSLAEF
jgi:hypothetical protein